MSAQTPSLRRLGLWIVALTFVLDQALKLWLLFGLRLAEEGPFQLASFLEIVLAWNRGISYGLFQQSTDIGRWALVVLSIVAAVWLWRWMWREPRGFSVFSLALIIGGALGNVFDRLVLGHVVDFLDFYWQRAHWPAFNLADSFIFIGAAMIVLDGFRGEKKEQA